MKVEINPSKKTIITFEGVDYPCSKPSMGVIQDMEDEIEAAKAENKGGVKAMLSFVSACGMPMEAVRKLDDDQLNQVIEALMPSKKA